MVMRADSVRGYLPLLLLTIIADRSPIHGYAIIEALEERSGGEFKIPEGSVYPALHRMLDLGYISRSATMHNGRRRLNYSMTSIGKRHLTNELAQWDLLSSTVNRVIGPGGS